MCKQEDINKCLNCKKRHCVEDNVPRSEKISRRNLEIKRLKANGWSALMIRSIYPELAEQTIYQIIAS
jgi:hypothetical protein